MSKIQGTPTNVNILVALVQSEVANNPFRYDGHDWCAKPQRELCGHVGVGDRQLRRLFDQAGLESDRARGRYGKNVCLLRPRGDKPSYSIKQETKYLLKIWEGRTGRPHTRTDFGNVYHFVKGCPPGKAKAVFKLALSDWGAFMACLKVHHDFKHPDNPRHYKHPRLPVLRACVHVAVDLWLQTEQAKGHHIDISWYSSN